MIFAHVRSRWVFALLALAVVRAEGKNILLPDPLILRTTAAGTALIIGADGLVQNVAIAVKQLKAPDGHELAPSDIVLNPISVAELAPTGVHIVIIPAPGALTAAGDYAITLYAEGTDGTVKVSALKSGTLTVIKPEISSQSLKDSQIVLNRSLPWCGATDEFPFDLLLGGTSPAAGVTFGSHVGPAADNATARFGSVSVGRAHGAERIRNYVPPGLSRWTLYFDGFPSAGTFPVTLLIHTPGAAAPVETAFKVIVTDAPLLPLLAIAAGVLLALAVQLIANRFRPHEENRLRVLELLSAVQKLRATTSDAGHGTTLDGFEAGLRDAEVLTDDRSFAAAKAQLDAIGNDIAAERKKIQDERIAANDLLAIVEDSINRALAAPNLAAGEMAIVQQLQQQANGAAAEIKALHYLSANRTLTQVQTALAPIIQSLPLAAPAAAGIRRARRGGAGAAAPAAAGTPTLDVDDDESALVTGRELSFIIGNPDATWTGAASIRWNFGDGTTPPPTSTPRALHTYQSAAAYSVSASARDAQDAELAKLSLRIAIALSPEERARANARKSLDSYDFAVSAISVIVAVATGMWLLYAGKAFGTLAQYTEAFVWGFGIDNTVRGFTSVMKKVSG